MRSRRGEPCGNSRSRKRRAVRASCGDERPQRLRRGRGNVGRRPIDMRRISGHDHPPPSRAAPNCASTRHKPAAHRKFVAHPRERGQHGISWTLLASSRRRRREERKRRHDSDLGDGHRDPRVHCQLSRTSATFASELPMAGSGCLGGLATNGGNWRTARFMHPQVRGSHPSTLSHSHSSTRHAQAGKPDVPVASTPHLGATEFSAPPEAEATRGANAPGIPSHAARPAGAALLSGNRGSPRR